jgi:hypothetical protein
LSFSMHATEKCKKNAVRLVRRLYRARKVLIVNSRPPGGHIDVSPGWRNITIYIDPMITKHDIKDPLILGLVMTYRKKSIARGIAEALAILSVAFVGSFADVVSGLWSTILYLITILMSALIAGYIIILFRRTTVKQGFWQPWVSVVLSDPLCRATVDSIKELLEWAIGLRDEELRMSEEATGKFRWPRRLVTSNHYKDIVKKYSTIISLIGFQ